MLPLLQEVHLSLLMTQHPQTSIAEQLHARFQQLQELLRLAEDRWTSLQTMFTEKLKTMTTFCDANFAFVRDLERLKLPQLDDLVTPCSLIAPDLLSFLNQA